VSSVAEYLNIGFKIHRLKKQEGARPGSTPEADISCAAGFMDGFQVIGTSSNREEHCASMIDCICAVMIDDVEG
jgi:hypothetical protein